MTTSASYDGATERPTRARPTELPQEPELPPRPPAIRWAVAATCLIALVLSGVWPVRFTPIAGDSMLAVTPSDVVTAVVAAGILGGPVVFTAVQLWRGATLAYATAVAVAALAVTGMGALYLLRIYFDLRLGESVPGGLDGIVTSTTGAACTVMALLALVALICLRTTKSRDWAARMHGYRIDRRLQRRGRPAYHPPTPDV